MTPASLATVLAVSVLGEASPALSSLQDLMQDNKNKRLLLEKLISLSSAVWTNLLI